MNANRFDAIAKVLIARSSRRRTLSGLLSGTLALLGLAASGEAAPNGTCKPKCGKCERCKKGRCQPKPNGQRCGKCKECRRGECRAVANGVECGDDRTCQGGKCRCLPELDECPGTGECIAGCGSTAFNPIECTCCLAAGQGCTSFGTPCCSGNCVKADPDDIVGACRSRDEGDECDFNAQCTSNDCRNGRCAAL